MIGYVEESQYLPVSLRPRPPELEFPPPDCSLCGGTLEHDGDGWDCHTCKASWASDGSRGHYVNDDYSRVDASPACLSTIEPHNRPSLPAKYEDLRHLREQCILPAGHEGEHRNDFNQWDHRDPRIVHHSVEDHEYLFDPEG